MKTYSICRHGLAAAIALLVSISASALRASTPVDGPCELVLAANDKLLATAARQDAALAEAVARMNAAEGEEKTALMAAIINTLAQQRAEERAAWGRMRLRALAHLIEHLESGVESLAACPALNDTAGRPAAPTLVAP